MNYHDAFGVPGVVTRMFNNYGPRQNPRYVTGTIITQALTRETIELGNLEPLRDFCFCTDGVRGHLTVAAQGTPGDVYVYGQGENISMRDWVELILRLGEEDGFWPGDREIVSAAARHRPGLERRARAARRAREAHARDRLAAARLVGGRRARRRSAGTRRTATAGSAASTGCRPEHRRYSADVSAAIGPSLFLGVERAENHEIVLHSGRLGLPEEHDLSVAFEPRLDDVGSGNRDVCPIHASASFSELPSETVTRFPSTVATSAPRPALAATGSSLTGS